MNQITKEQNKIHPKKAAVFLDRDGTLIHDRGHIKDPSEVKFYSQAFPALRQLQQHFELFFVTNQWGIAEGVLRPRAVDRVNQHIVSILADRDIHIRDTFVCPHKYEDNCFCRKPKPYFLEQAARRYGLNLKASFTVGDHPCDIQLADNVGATGVYVLTGHGQKHRHDLPEDTNVVVDILQASECIWALMDDRTTLSRDQTEKTFILDLMVACELWLRPELGPVPVNTQQVAQVLRQAGISVLEISGGWLECEFRPLGIWEALTGQAASQQWIARYRDSSEASGKILDLLPGNM